MSPAWASARFRRLGCVLENPFYFLARERVMSPLLAVFGIGTTEMIVVSRGIKEFKEGINDPTTEDDEHLEDVKPKKSPEDAVN